jgi:hypothetical protein
VEAQLQALDAKRAAIARRYVARLALEPISGTGSRARYLPRRSAEPCTSIAAAGPTTCSVRAARRDGAPKDPSAGPAYRVVYRLLEAKRIGVRVVQVLGVGRAHVREGDIYTTAARLHVRLNWRAP